MKPYPDPKNTSNTNWLTKEEIKSKALEPSRKWVHAGQGDLGYLYLEVIRCKDLPNLDSGAGGDFTDSFVAMVFEGKYFKL